MQRLHSEVPPATPHTCPPTSWRGRSVSVHAARRPPRQGSTYLSEPLPVDNTPSPIDRFKEAADITKKGGRFKSAFIWNTKWKEGLEFQESGEENRRRAEQAGPAKAVGGLGLARLHSLNDMAQDLTEQLKPRSSPAAPRQPARKLPGRADTIKPTQGEQRRWGRQASYLRQAAGKQSSSPASPEELAAKKQDYDGMKVELQGLTAALVVLGVCACALFYSQETAGSYAAGGLGGFVYLRMLQRSVDSFGGAPSSPAAMVGSMTSNNRLLVPFALCLAFNRWNAVAAPQIGASAQLLPMLLGFFTYKAAILGRGSVDILGDLTSSKPASTGSTENVSDAS